MSLFETEVAELSRNYIRCMNKLEENRASAEMIEQVGNMLREAGIANHASILVHGHYNPPKLDFRTVVYTRADSLPRLVELLDALAATKGGSLSVCEEGYYKQKTIYLQLPEFHRLEIDFDAKEISREMLIEAVGGKVAEVEA